MEVVLPDCPFIVRTRLEELDASLPEAMQIILAEYDAWDPAGDEGNFEVQSKHPFFGALYESFLTAAREYFLPLTLHPSNSRSCWAYVQSAEDFSEVWHDHIATATINGVFYLNVPDPQGQLWFRRLG